MRALAAVAARLVDGLTWVVRCAIVLMLTAVLLLTASQAVDRYLLHTSFDAYEQLACAGVTWVTFFGFALGYRERANLRIELIDTMLSPRANTVKRMVFDICILALAIAVNVNGWRVLEVASNQDILGTPFTNAIVYWSLQSGTILIGIYAVAHILDGALSLRGTAA